MRKFSHTFANRAPFQVLVIPFRISDDGVEYALMRREARTGGYWQPVAGGGEPGETPLQAARRETAEEAGLPLDSFFIELDSRVFLPIVGVNEYAIVFDPIEGTPQFGPDLLVLPEYAFGVAVENREILLSHEHTELAWLQYNEANARLHWDSNKSALWELDVRVTRLRHERRIP